MSMSTGVLPQKRSADAATEYGESPEDSQLIDCFAEGKVAGDNYNVAREVSDSDDDMYLDSIEMYSWDKIAGWRPKPPDLLPFLSNRSSTWAEPLDICTLCRAEIGHMFYECPYRCEEIFDNARCLKKVHQDDDHFYGEPCADCENTEFGCDVHGF